MAENNLTLDIGSGRNPRGTINIDRPDSNHHRAGKPIKILRNINFLYADAQNLPFRDKTFTRSFSHHVLEHIPNPHKALQEMNRVTQTKVKLMVPSEHNIGDITSTVHLYTWNPRTLKNLAQKTFPQAETHYIARHTLMPPYRKILRFLPFLNSLLSKLGIHPEIYLEATPT